MYFMLRFNCPKCYARYQLSNSALGSAGRQVKCTRCEHTWHQLPIADNLVKSAAKTPPMPPQDHTQTVELELKQLRASRTKFWISALAIALVLALATGIWQMRGWWQTTPEEIAVENVNYQTRQSSSGSQIVVAGSVHNLAPIPLPLNPLTVQLISTRTGNVVDHWPVEFSQKVLGAGQSQKWQVKFNQPATTDSLQIKTFFETEANAGLTQQ